MGMFVALALASFSQADGDPVVITQSWIAQPTAIGNPVLQRIADAAAWKEFWKRHTKSAAEPPAVNFEELMVLVLPGEVAVGEEVAPAQSGVQARLTDAALTVSFTLVIKAEDLPPAAGAKTRTLLTIVALQRTSKPVEFRRRSDDKDASFTPAGKVDGLPGALTLRGVLRRNPVEGGFWMLEAGPKRYDLHGKVEGLTSGDRVEISGLIPAGVLCFHGGIIFDLESMRSWKEK